MKSRLQIDRLLRSNFKRFINRDLDKKLEKTKLLKAKFLLSQVITKKVIDIITIRSREFCIIISKKYTNTSRTYKNLVYY